MTNPATRLTALLLLALLPHSLQQQQQQEPTRTLHVSTGQQLADAVAEWGRAGGDLVIQVDSWYISLANVTIQQLQASPGQRVPFSSGNLRLVGLWNDRENMTLVNTAMRQLTPPMRGARITMEQLWTFNNCEEYVPFLSPQGPALFRASYLGLFPWAFYYQSISSNNTGVFMAKAALSGQAYLGGVWRIPLLPVQRIMAPFLSSLPAFKTVVARSSSTLVEVAAFQSDQVVMYNAVGKSLSDMDDPVLQRLRAQGLLMPPQFCNGSLLPPELANAEVDTLTPAWLSTTTEGFLTTLQKAIALTSSPTRKNDTQWMPVPSVGLFGNATLPATMQLGLIRWPLLLLGPFNDVPATAVTAILDLQQDIDTIRLGPTGKLLIQQLTLTGLGSRVLNSSTELDSALPIAAVSPPPGSNPLTSEAHVWMHNVTLMLPARDFLALTILALDNTPDSIRGCVSPDVRGFADELQRGIRGMSAAGVDLVNQRLVLSSFVGWGVNATTLVLVPELPVPQLSACNSQQSKTCGNLTCGQLGGLLAGVLSGVLIGLISAWLWRRHSITGAQQRKASGKPQVALTLCKDGSAAGHPSSNLSFTPLGRELAKLASQSTGNTPGSASISNMDHSTDAKQHPRDLVKAKAMQLNNDAESVIITSVLGHGGSGVVFRGTWRGLHVAVKTVVFEGHDSRAVNEASISSMVSHPNIVSTYRYDIKQVEPSVNDSQGLEVVLEPQVTSSQQHPQTFKLFLVQELCDFNLSFILARRMLHHHVTRQVDWLSLLNLLQDIATGLQFLHDNNIMHGDLKPCNVLIKCSALPGIYVVAKLADFGLSRHLQGGATHISNFKAGTPFYVAPEVVDHGRTSKASDIYSLGVIMWECATGYTLHYVMPDGRLAWSPLYPQLPDHIKCDPAYVDLLNRCIASEPTKRPSAADFIQQVREIMSRT